MATETQRSELEELIEWLETENQKMLAESGMMLHSHERIEQIAVRKGLRIALDKAREIYAKGHLIALTEYLKGQL